MVGMNFCGECSAPKKVGYVTCVLGEGCMVEKEKGHEARVYEEGRKCKHCPRLLTRGRQCQKVAGKERNEK